MHSLRHPASLPLGNTLPRAARIRLASVSRAVRAQEEEVLVPEGETPGCWHFIDTGAVALSSSSRGGRRCILSIVGAGGLFGPSLSQTNDGRSARPEARALVASTLLLVPAAALDRLLAEDGSFGAWMCATLQRQCDRFQKSLALTLGRPLPERLLETFALLAHTHGRPTAEGVFIPFPLRQERMASLVGASRESVNRALKRLERAGIVRRAGRSYVVCASLLAQEEAFGEMPP